MTCNVCQGRRTVRLTTFATLASVGGPDIVDTPSLDPGYEEFPCPKCGPLRVKVERIGAVKSVSSIREDNRKIAGYVDHIKADLASRIGREMLKNNWIDFEERFDNFSGNTALCAIGYVAHPDIGRKAVASKAPELPKQQAIRRTVDIRDMKVTIVFDTEIGSGRGATISTEQPNGEVRSYDAVVADCSIRLNEPQSFEVVGNPFVSRAFAGPCGFDLSVDLKCNGIAVQLKDGDGTPSTPINAKPPRDPFAREIDIE